MQRENDGWIVNGKIQARLVVGAGGHFCPVAKLTGAKPARENAVVAQEAEFEMDHRQQAGCRVRPDTPELYFCADIKGYGWCFRKDNYLNIGLGRMDQHRLSEHVAAFVRFLKSAGRISFDVPSALLGHAYLLYGVSERKVADDGVLLIGDAAGLAYKQSGEGIRPAIESGLLAAQAISAAQGNYSRESLGAYEKLLARRFGTIRPGLGLARWRASAVGLDRRAGKAAARGTLVCARCCDRPLVPARERAGAVRNHVRIRIPTRLPPRRPAPELPRRRSDMRARST